MFTFAPTDGQSRAELHADLLEAAKALTHGEPDGIANMANLAALIWQYLPDLNWAGFYRMVGGELVLGPFVGKPACIRIPLLVPDVHAFPGHIACDAASRSELVVPVIRDGVVIAVIDLDSPSPARFDEDDARGIEALAAAIAGRI